MTDTPKDTLISPEGKVPILCIPVGLKGRGFKPDGEQQQIEDCPVCHEQMWTSKKKREYRDTGYYMLICGYCLLQIAKQQGFEFQPVTMDEFERKH